jgi:hypothetical protein
LKLAPSIVHLCHQFLCRRIPRSLHRVHFHANVLLDMVGADARFREWWRVDESGWNDGL